MIDMPNGMWSDHKIDYKVQWSEQTKMKNVPTLKVLSENKRSVITKLPTLNFENMYSFKKRNR